MLCEVNDLAGQHEVIAENLQSDVIGKIIYLVKEIKDERKKVNIYRQTVFHSYNLCTVFENGIRTYCAVLTSVVIVINVLLLTVTSRQCKICSND